MGLFGLMLDRLATHSPILQLAAHCRVDLTVPSWHQRYRIRLGEEVPTVIQDRSRRLGTMRWGWNAPATLHGQLRAEEVCSRHRRDLSHRCLVLFNAIYVVVPGRPQGTPWAILPHGGAPCAAAGLWQADAARAGGPGCCVLITAIAPADIRSLAGRMPVILTDHDLDRWLQPTLALQELPPLLQPQCFSDSRIYAVGPEILSDNASDSARMLQALEDRADLA